jgi:hypothetical protein
MRRTVTGCAVASLQSTSRASARAVVVRAALGVTMSARPGSFFARVGTHRATGLGVPATARRQLPLLLCKVTGNMCTDLHPSQHPAVEAGPHRHPSGKAGAASEAAAGQGCASPGIRAVRPSGCLRQSMKFPFWSLHSFSGCLNSR